MSTSSLDRFIPRSRQSILAWLAVIVTAYSVVRISRSYSVLCQTDDEPAHVAAGMQFLVNGGCTIRPVDPPVPKIAAAVLPYLDGARPHTDPDQYVQGTEIFTGQGNYWRTLTLARIGILPLYLLGVLLLWSWSKKLYGDEAAFLAVLFYILLPSILGNAGVAATDLAIASTFLGFCYALWWWLQRPTTKRTLVLGVAIGIAAGTKFSFIVFFPPVAIIIVAYELFVLRKMRITPERLRKASKLLGLALVVAFGSLWACYRFSYGPLHLDSPSASCPMPEFFEGLSAVFLKNHVGHAIWFMGKQQFNHGSIWYFPVGLALKTPIAFLLLAFAGAALIFLQNNAWRTKDYLKSRELLPLLISAALLAVVMPSDINLGVRHILPIYPFLAMLAALGARWLFTLPKAYGVTAFVVLLTWMFASSVSADTDDISYFNEFAGQKPEHFLIVADLDWGQDGARLIDTLKARGVTHLAFQYMGTAPLASLGLPSVEDLYLGTAPGTNWVAISIVRLYCNDGYAWLLKETPEAKIGKSILLYHFSDDDLARLRIELPGSNGSPANADERSSTAEIARAEALAAQSPTPGNFLNLSLDYYNAKRYNDCVTAARKSIELKPDFTDAYNNAAAGFLQMSQWDSAISAATEAIRLKPDFQLAKNNLAAAIDGKKRQEENLANMEKTASEQPTPESYLALSAAYYQVSQFEKCIAAARKAIAMRPEYGDAYNNICTAENVLGNFDEARKAGEEAVRLQPDNQLAKNNLNWAIQHSQKK